MRKKRGIIFSLLIILILISTVILPGKIVNSQQIKPGINQGIIKKELRGVWLTNIDSNVLFSQRNIQQAVNRLAQLNFNTVYPTVWQENYTLYPSKIMKREIGQEIEPKPGLIGRDPLKELVKESRSKGLAVIPWFEFGFMASANADLVKKHPDWVTKKRDGSTIWKEGKIDRVWLNPFHPEVQKFILSLVTEIVSNYDINGIQFDDHFGLPVEFGYDDFTRSLYRKEINNKDIPNDFQDIFWVRWRVEKINAFMAEIFSTVKKIKPKCIISVSPNPFPYALPVHLQDWLTWERKGYLEELIVQVYRPDLERFITEIERSEVELAKTHIPVAIGILTGLKNRPTPLSQIEKQVEEVRKRGFGGVSFFFYESLWNMGAETVVERQKAWQKIFPLRVSRPQIGT